MEIVYLNFEHKSFSWANGLYIVVGINTETGEYNLCQLNEKGEPQLYDDGRYMLSHTGLKNSGVKKTNLVYLDKKSLRKEKLKEINENKA